MKNGHGSDYHSVIFSFRDDSISVFHIKPLLKKDLFTRSVSKLQHCNHFIWNNAYYLAVTQTIHKEQIYLSNLTDFFQKLQRDSHGLRSTSHMFL